MSRVGKLPVKLPQGIKVDIKGSVLNFDNGNVIKSYRVMPSIEVLRCQNDLKLVKKSDSTGCSNQIGMDRSNIKNIVLGMQIPFKIILEINGVGYKVMIDDRAAILSLGYSHEIYYVLPINVKLCFEKLNLVILSSDDKILVGQVASEIISFRKPEPYKGKGVKVFGKAIIRKEGKKK